MVSEDENNAGKSKYHFEKHNAPDSTWWATRPGCSLTLLTFCRCFLLLRLLLILLFPVAPTRGRFLQDSDKMVFA